MNDTHLLPFLHPQSLLNTLKSIDFAPKMAFLCFIIQQVNEQVKQKRTALLARYSALYLSIYVKKIPMGTTVMLPHFSISRIWKFRFCFFPFDS